MKSKLYKIVPDRIRDFTMKHSNLSLILFIFVSFVLSRLLMYGVYCYYKAPADLSTFLESFHKCDAGWYRQYVNDIYNHEMFQNVGNGQASWAFFPLMPLIMAGVWKLTNFKVTLQVVAFFVNAVLLMISEFFAYKYIELTRRRKDMGLYYIFFMSFGLYSFYFSILYTEALFICLLTLCFYFMKKKNYILVGVFGALLSATRNVGIMFVFVVLVNLIVEYVRDNGIAKKSVGNFVSSNIRNDKLIIGVSLIPLGLFTYMFFLKKYLGDGLAFVHVMKTWGRQVSRYPFESAKVAVIDTFPTDYLGIAMVISVALIFYAIVHNRRYEEVVMPIIVLCLSSSTILESVPRYMLGCFTVSLVFVEAYSNMSKTSKFIFASAIVLLECVMVREWIWGNPCLA